jgi:hypothetical protein
MIKVEFESTDGQSPSTLERALAKGINDLLCGIAFAAGIKATTGIKAASVNAVVCEQEISS